MLFCLCAFHCVSLILSLGNSIRSHDVPASPHLICRCSDLLCSLAVWRSVLRVNVCMPPVIFLRMFCLLWCCQKSGQFNYDSVWFGGRNCSFYKGFFGNCMAVFSCWLGYYFVFAVRVVRPVWWFTYCFVFTVAVFGARVLTKPSFFLCVLFLLSFGHYLSVPDIIYHQTISLAYSLSWIYSSV